MREEGKDRDQRKIFSYLLCSQRNGKYDFKIIVLYHTYMFYALILVISNSHHMFHQGKITILMSQKFHICLFNILSSHYV